jgi:hypothetical protein
MLKQGNGVCYVAYIILREEHERSHFGDVRTRRRLPAYQTTSTLHKTIVKIALRFV